jgi:hypothetical protein
MSNENAVVVATNNGLVSYETAKGAKHVTPTAALAIGGKALAGLKSQAGSIAVAGVKAGRYRAAAEILADAFPKVAKGFESFYNAAPWKDKAAMGVFVNAVINAPAGAKGYTKKQLSARAMLGELQSTLGLSPVAQGEVVAETN